MSVARRLKRQIKREAAKKGTDELMARLESASRDTEKTMLAEQKEHAREISALMMAVPTRVLVMDMNWLPLEGGENDKKRKLMQFARKAGTALNRNSVPLWATI